MSDSSFDCYLNEQYVEPLLKSLSTGTHTSFELYATTGSPVCHCNGNIIVKSNLDMANYGIIPEQNATVSPALYHHTWFIGDGSQLQASPSYVEYTQSADHNAATKMLYLNISSILVKVRDLSSSDCIGADSYKFDLDSSLNCKSYGYH